ncbi:PIN domain-like protein [Ramaria rubella]|nr:PIN domain-like protein [Ramaria rubella]
MPCENRHVLGWYRLVRELKESGVGIICVFDGAKRGLAKQRETERRRRAQRMELARGAMEQERLRRLRRLTILMKQYGALPDNQRDRLTQALQEVIRKAHGPQGTLQDVIQLYPNERPLRDGFPSLSLKESSSLNELTNVLQFPSLGTAHTLRESAASRVRILSSSEPTEVGQMVGSPEFPDSKTSMEPHHTNYTTAADPPGELPRNDGTTSPQLTKEKSQQDSQYLNSSNVLPSDTGYELPAKNSIESPRASNTTEDVILDFGTLPNPALSVLHSTYISESSARDPIEDKAEFLMEFPNFFEPPTNIFLDSFGLVSALHPHATEPPDDLFPDMEESTVSHDSDTWDTDENLAEKFQQDADSTPQPDEITKGLLSLYDNYFQSIPVVMASPLIESPATGSSEADTGAREQYAMSKNQVQLTVDEGSLWHAFIDPTAPGESRAEEKLDDLAKRSESLSKSYEKRNNAPTPKTYEESKLILKAMGIPCIETVAPYEAEALAASLVHHGHADYVASEDTDVLVYEAPLLRNITNRQSPLTLLSGAEIRRVLQLDRASYVDFALLLGTDFSQRIKNLGPHRAIRLIRTHGRIEHVIANEPRFTPHLSPEAYLEQVELARLVFETLPPPPDPKFLQPTESDEDLVTAILEKYGVHRAAMVDWDFAGALDGNYFNDNPSMA